MPQIYVDLGNVNGLTALPVGPEFIQRFVNEAAYVQLAAFVGLDPVENEQCCDADRELQLRAGHVAGHMFPAA